MAVGMRGFENGKNTHGKEALPHHQHKNSK
jgi:hypothetical protein